MATWTGTGSDQQMFNYFPERGVMAHLILGDQVIFRQNGHEWSESRGWVMRTEVVRRIDAPAYQKVRVQLPQGVVEGPCRFFYLDN